MKVAAIYIAPVKSLGLKRVQRTYVTKRGLSGDREFFLATRDNRQFTMRDFGPLATVAATFDAASRTLELRLPGREVVAAVATDGESVVARFFGEYDVAGFEVPGPWNEALSSFTRHDVRLIRSGDRRSSVDVMPVSLLSDASLAALRTASGEMGFEERRFRPNVFLEGAGREHEEDDWLGREVRIGEAVVHVRMRDPRCVMTTLHPDTGLRDHDTLNMIAGYRKDQPGQVNFGVYGTVAVEGEIAVGDEVEVLEGR